MHLEDGDRLDNVVDMIKRNPRFRPGVPHWTAKLDEADVAEIKALLAEGVMLQREIGERYGVSQPTISDIARGVFRVDSRQGKARRKMSDDQAAQNS